MPDSLRDAQVPVSVIRAHWLVQVECDHATGHDRPHCACSLVDLGWHGSVGHAVEAWIAHLLAERG